MSSMAHVRSEICLVRGGSVLDAVILQDLLAEKYVKGPDSQFIISYLQLFNSQTHQVRFFFTSRYVLLKKNLAN